MKTAGGYAVTLRYNLLDEPLIRTRLVADGQPKSFSLPALFVALANDEVRDFPALRPHQRHPWHAFLVQLAAMALHRAAREEVFDTESAWKEALLGLTPDDPDGAAWCLISPHDRPAFMQAPVPGGSVDSWDRIEAADQLDMLITSKNHDLKAARIRHGEIDDWLMALVSLQTQEGYGGKKNFGISRMAGGFGCRIAMGASPSGYFGRRWRRDLSVLLNSRVAAIERYGLKEKDGHELLWLLPWDGKSALSFSSLDPFYIEICRQVRLIPGDEVGLSAKTSVSEVARIAEHSPRGGTGDVWTPIDAASGEALRVRASGFGYELASALLFGSKYRKSEYKQPQAMGLKESDGDIGVVALLQAVSRGGATGNKSATEGYHERRIPISRTVRKLIYTKQTDRLAKIAGEHVYAVGKLASLLRNSILLLLDGGKTRNNSRDISESLGKKADKLAVAFEEAEDARFFDVLNAEVESDQPETEHLNWLLSMASSAETILKNAFAAGPQCGEQRYRAQAAALSRFHAGLRSTKTLPVLAEYYRQQSNNKELAL